jgi:hypothetical protein
MDIFNAIAGTASIIGLIASGIAAFLARSASQAAKAARDAALVRSLADELSSSSQHAEQLLDFLQQARYMEANLRANELFAVLVELPHRRSPYLSEEHQGSLKDSSLQVQSIGDAIFKYNEGGDSDNLDRDQSIKVARLVVTTLREVLGDVRSRIEQGGMR